MSPTPDVPGALNAVHSTFSSSQLSQDAPTLTQFGSTFGSFAPPTPPLIIVHAESTQDVVACVNIATKFGIVIIPVGGRTSLEGQFLPPSIPEAPSCCHPPLEDRTLPRTVDSGKPSGTPLGKLETSPPPSPSPPPTLNSSRPTIHLSLSRMDTIQLFPSDFSAIVGPGAGWQSLNERLAEEGVKQFFPIDPAPRSEFGGMVGVGGSGTNAVGFGTMRGEWVGGMEVVLMSGEVIKTKGSSRARKSSTGWDVGRLFLGSEGTLGIITSITVRLAPLVPLKVAIASFPSISQAVLSVVSIIQAGLNPTSLELLDGLSIKAMNLAEMMPKPLEEIPTVMMRFGSPFPEAVNGAMEKVEEIVKGFGCREFRVAKDDRESEVFWKARKAQYWSQQLLLSPSPTSTPCRTLITDICVPISQLPSFITQSEALVNPLASKGILAPVVAHAGDGNVHRAILYLPHPQTGLAPKEVGELAEALSSLALELGGTVAGEHGIGMTKRKYLRKELGEGTLGLMRKVKSLLDPLGLLNPGKVIYETVEEERRESRL
ncbi:BZ3500_MvSof-1268-A1-R1_Chr9g10478 [Microbotryum saponariae]|uniref:D-lactate dehydrogenase (cytochrome) n=1 Tax=Microbotryum saponariae TaxID=289078 RepID=A0A2X0L6P0_9BASI|nr:BZ3500_MvSof-1268-A1-R1_Chr9g10478 [Microbotryum saponariae]